mgnify:CR=1 FL=1
MMTRLLGYGVCAWALLGCEPGDVLVNVEDVAVVGDAPGGGDVTAGDGGQVDVATSRDGAVEGGMDVARDVAPEATVAEVGVDAEMRDMAAPEADPGVDDATIESVTFPGTLGCTAHTSATVVVRNTGTTTWTTAAGYALGTVDDSDPLYTSDTRVRFPAGESVAPGATREFTIPLAAPGREGDYTTDWRMVHDGVRWFGAQTTQRVHVQCETTAVSDFRLSDVTIVSSPDVRGFAVTSRITSLSFRPGTFHIDHTRRGMWPPIVIADDGTTQEATVWVFFHIGGRWYATGGERLRPNQTDKALDNPSHIGPGWLYDPGRWREMTNYVPAPGELVGFMVVAGSTRSDDRVMVRERTGVVLLPFPRDDVSTEYPPFAWEE